MSNAYIGDYEGPALTGVDWQGGIGNWGLAKFGDDRRAIVFFHKQAVYNEVKSTQAGRRIYDDVDFVSIQHPGEREQKIDRPVKPNEDPLRWPSQWSQYQKKQEQTVDGTPLSLLFVQNPAIAETLKSFGVSTVEQLANLSATAMQNIGMGAQDYVNYAQSYLQHAQKGVGFHQMKRELEERDRKIKVQDERITMLTGQLDQLLKQNAAIIAATPAAAAALAGVNGPGVDMSALQPSQGSALPPIPVHMPKTEPPMDKMAAMRAARARKAQERQGAGGE